MSRDVAIVSFASTSVTNTDVTETQLLYPVVTEAIEQSGIRRDEIEFTCAGSCDYLQGAPFAFVSNLEATGAWPPISESHVEMDGAWALYEAWVRLQDGDIDVALAFSSGVSSRAVDLNEVTNVQLDPYYLMPLWPGHLALNALQARALLDKGTYTERDFAAVAARSRSDGRSVDDLLNEPYVASPLRAHDLPPVNDGAAAVVMVAGDRAKEVCSRPAWITGIDHRTDAHYPGVRDLATATSARIAAEKAGVGDGDVDVAELYAATSAQELILRDALGLGDKVEINPSGGALASHPFMVAGLTRIGEAFRQINENGCNRVVAHATSGPALQQNLVAVLSAEMNTLAAPTMNGVAR
ncbi:MAG: lipid-transfer protein [Actinobacteria bacterium]|nr:lipid-transfer protein [Actinomycetota bacterium]